MSRAMFGVDPVVTQLPVNEMPPTARSGFDLVLDEVVEAQELSSEDGLRFSTLNRGTRDVLRPIIGAGCDPGDGEACRAMMMVLNGDRRRITKYSTVVLSCPIRAFDTAAKARDYEAKAMPNCRDCHTRIAKELVERLATIGEVGGEVAANLAETRAAYAKVFSFEPAPAPDPEAAEESSEPTV